MSNMDENEQPKEDPTEEVPTISMISGEQPEEEVLDPPEETEIITDQPEEDEELPAGILRLHEEWIKQGLIPTEQPKEQHVELQPIIFPEPVGDYKVPAEDARTRLGLSEEAMERLLESGELDSILVKYDDDVRRMVSEAALGRFVIDSGMDAVLVEKLTEPAPELGGVLEAIREEIRSMSDLHARQLQQFKDILLLELRNLKEQDRDLTAFVDDLTAALEEQFPKLKNRKRTLPPWELCVIRNAKNPSFMCRVSCIMYLHITVREKDYEIRRYS